MKNNIVVCWCVFFMLAGTLFSSAHSSYAIGNMDDWAAKRAYQRRSFLKSFCSRRCSIGRGGNVCKCNGFHFAGKRAMSDSNVLLGDDDRITRDDNVPSSDDFYKILEDNNKLSMKPEEYESMMGKEELVRRTYRPNIDTIVNPSYLKGSFRNRFDPILETLLQTFVYNEDQ